MEKTLAVSEKSDQGQACVNTVEGVYLGSVLFSIFTGIGTVPRFFKKTIIMYNRENFLKLNIKSFFTISIERKEACYGRSGSFGTER